MKNDWLTIPLSEYLFINDLFDDCTCDKSDNIYYLHKAGKGFIVKCLGCNYKVKGTGMTAAMITWNKKQRNVL